MKNILEVIKANKKEIINKSLLIAGAVIGTLAVSKIVSGDVEVEEMDQLEAEYNVTEEEVVQEDEPKTEE